MIKLKWFKLILISFLFLISISLKSQIIIDSYQLCDTVMYTIGDVDLDHISDTLYYDSKKESLIFLLSSIDFKPIITRFELYANKYIMDIKGFFSFCEYDMRYTRNYSFCYDKKKQDFRLYNNSFEYYGYGDGDGRGYFSYDLDNGKFYADWQYYDCLYDSINVIDICSMIKPSRPFFFINDSINNYNIINNDSIYSYYRTKNIIEDRVKHLDLKKFIKNPKIKTVDKKDKDYTSEVFWDKYSISLNNYLGQEPVNVMDICFDNVCLFKLDEKKNMVKYFILLNNNYAILSVNKKTLKTTIKYYINYMEEQYNLANIVEKELSPL